MHLVPQHGSVLLHLRDCGAGHGAVPRRLAPGRVPPPGQRGEPVEEVKKHTIFLQTYEKFQKLDKLKIDVL